MSTKISAERFGRYRTMTKKVQKYPLTIVIVDEIVFINGKCYHKIKREKKIKIKTAKTKKYRLRVRPENDRRAAGSFRRRCFRFYDYYITIVVKLIIDAVSGFFSSFHPFHLQTRATRRQVRTTGNLIIGWQCRLNRRAPLTNIYGRDDNISVTCVGLPKTDLK